MPVALQALVNERFVSLEPPTLLNLKADQNSAGETIWFDLVDLGGGYVALRSTKTGKYVCAENAGAAPLVCNRDQIAEWETFLKVDLGNQRIALRAVNRQFVCCEDAGSGLLIANRASVGEWETFQLDHRFADDGLVHQLTLEFGIGADDLRGGDDNINMILVTKDGTRRHYPNLNGGSSWPANRWPRARVVLDPPVAPEQLSAVILTTEFGGGLSGDNCDLVSIAIKADGPLGGRTIGTGGPIRFTGSIRSITIPIDSSPRLHVAFKTGNDDLRGGGDDVSVRLGFANGAARLFDNVNKGMCWPNGLTRVVHLELASEDDLADLETLTILTASRGGWNGDNWSMDWVRATATTGDVEEVLFTHAYHRFTGDDHELVLHRLR